MGLSGNIFQVIVLLLSAVSAGMFIYSYKERSEYYMKLGINILKASIVSVTIASIILIVALVISDFSIEYVARYTDLSLPLFYKISGLWAGQAGSLLFWLLLIGLFTYIEIIRLKKQSLEYKSVVFAVLSLSMVFFGFLCVFEQNPFKMLDFIPRNGQGLNPMLQNPGMVIHPPTLYIGYVGFNIVIAHAFAALITNDFSNTWIKLARTWTIITWIFLTLGIVIGGWWAYVELGWGGYWAWDPVENASLLPWLTATAFIHTSMIYSAKGRLKAWGFILALITFELTIFGTFITRSGVIESVHSFSKDSIGNFFLIFMGLSSIIFIYLLYRHRRILADEAEFKYFSREGVFFIANWLFLATTFVVLFGTVLPWFSEMFTGSKSTVELSYFNRVSLPFFSAIILLSGVGLLIKFGNHTVSSFLKVLIIPTVAMVVAMAVFVGLGYTIPSSVILIGFMAFSLTALIIRKWQLFKGSSSILSVLKYKNTALSAVIIHFGVILMAFGVTMSAFYNKETDEVVIQDSTLQVDQYELKIGKIVEKRYDNFNAFYLEIEVLEDGKFVSYAYPEMRLYDSRPEQYFAEVSYYSMVKGDLYFILSGFDLEKSEARIQIIFQPFIGFMWVGCAVMSLGGFYTLMRFRKKGDIKGSEKTLE